MAGRGADRHTSGGLDRHRGAVCSGVSVGEEEQGAVWWFVGVLYRYDVVVVVTVALVVCVVRYRER